MILTNEIHPSLSSFEFFKPSYDCLVIRKMLEIASSDTPDLTKDEEELVKLLDYCLDLSFNEIFIAISKYCIQRFNNGKLEYVRYPYHKTDCKLILFKTILKQNNYKNYPMFKKWVDEVIFYA